MAPISARARRADRPTRRVFPRDMGQVSTKLYSWCCRRTAEYKSDAGGFKLVDLITETRSRGARARQKFPSRSRHQLPKLDEALSVFNCRKRTRTNIPSYRMPLSRSSSTKAWPLLLAGANERSVVMFTYASATAKFATTEESVRPEGFPGNRFRQTIRGDAQPLFAVSR